MSSTFFAVTSSSALFGEIGASRSVSTTPFKINTSTEETRTTCATWGADGTAFIATQNGSVDKYNRQGTHVGQIYAGPTAVIALAVKDAQVFVGHEGSICLVDSATGKQSDPEIPVTGVLKSLSLSHDKELLAITTGSDVHIYNLSTRVSTPLNTRSLKHGFVCGIFHPHRRTTLLVGCGSQIIVFDTLKPNAPTQTIALGSNQHVTSLCFSASIRGPVAVATRSGTVQLIDLEKDKSNLAQNFEFKVELSTVAISSDNNLLIAGTIDGQVLLQEIKTSDKAVQRTVVGQGEAIVALISLPKRTARAAAAAISAKVATTKSSTRGQPLGDNNTQRKPPARTLTRKISDESTADKKEMDPKSTQTSPPAKRRPLAKEITARVSNEANQIVRMRSAPQILQQKNSPIFRRSSPRVSSRVSGAGSATSSPSRSPIIASRVTVRPLQVTKRAGTNSPAASRTRPSSRFSQATTERLPTPDLPSLGGESTAHPHYYNLPSPPKLPPPKAPEEPQTATEPETPAPPINVSDSPKVDRAMLGLDTSEIQRWITQGPKKVEFMDSPQEVAFVSRSNTPSPTFRGPVQQKVQPRVTRIIHSQTMAPKTPSRRSSANVFGLDSGTVQLSPMRSPATRPGLGQANSVIAQEFIRGVVREAMSEQKEEQLEELKAMHLDMVKMGRAWKNELRTLMQEYVGDFKVLHEENAQLRAENERLRRGY